MRLWTIHPSYLDRAGLLAAWREGLLAQKVLAGKTAGYRHHPQLERFRAAERPEALIGRFLLELAEEAGRRGYRFDRDKIGGAELWAGERVAVAEGQIAYELALLESKLGLRDREWLAGLERRRAGEGEIALSPVFRRVEGGVAGWERARPEVLERLKSETQRREGIGERARRPLGRRGARLSFGRALG